MPSYPPLPFPPDRQDGAPPLEWGSAVLCFLLETGVTATCSDEALEQAERAAQLAAATTADTTDAARERIRRTRHLIAGALGARRQDSQPAPTPAVPMARPPEGPMAKLKPIRPTLSPVGDAIAF